MRSLSETTLKSCVAPGYVVSVALLPAAVAACTIAAQYGVAYSVPPASRRYFQSILVNIPHANANANYATADESAWLLPLPAVFLIRPDGVIAFAEAHADPRVRPEPSDILDLL